ncbi:ParB/RepB/Spo0J family partition protein [Massilia sp.]|uniref:ParB/RepB/Spo0J family partition protein n=1 Tax=Massilia sp. TaxID=1882437 RepID=UPI00352EDA89
MAKKSLDLKSFAGVVQSATQRGDQEIPIDLIDIHPQVRTQFDPEKQASINASIAAQGINQSLVLHAKSNGRYDLIAGEYRIRGAFANTLKTVPARVKHNLSPWEIRRIQVSENMERADISAFDEAIGVAKDVEGYGFEVAQQIWNRSEGWISKRTAVLKYGEPLRKLLEDGVLNDLEVAHSLNQLQQLNEQEYARFEKRLREGNPLSRDEVRGKVQQVKEWKKEEKQRKERKDSLSKAPPKEPTPPRQPAAAEPAASRPASGTEPATKAPAETGVSSASATSDASVGSAAAAVVSANADPVGEPAPQDKETAITTEQALVLDQMVTLFQNSVANHVLVKDVQKELEALGADRNQTEWAMWSLYQTVALPLLAALGETRAQRYLQRTVADLRNAKAQELWNKLHPTVDGAQSDDWSTTRDPVAPMPKDWSF